MQDLLLRQLKRETVAAGLGLPGLSCEWVTEIARLFALYDKAPSNF